MKHTDLNNTIIVFKGKHSNDFELVGFAFKDEADNKAAFEYLWKTRYSRRRKKWGWGIVDSEHWDCGGFEIQDCPELAKFRKDKYGEVAPKDYWCHYYD